MKGGEYGNNTHCDFAFAVDRRSTSLALQYHMGLLPEWRLGTDSAHYANLGFIGATLTIDCSKTDATRQF